MPGCRDRLIEWVAATLGTAALSVAALFATRLLISLSTFACVRDGLGSEARQAEKGKIMLELTHDVSEVL
jgi:hypothetical protein